jgi:hypothetical protein
MAAKARSLHVLGEIYQVGSHLLTGRVNWEAEPDPEMKYRHGTEPN